ncbi:MAG: terpene cyclase/mutase family protein [Planctomycetaceae bacterium]|nr:terpene cyclase/mutase family protein [Planctomycetaceae bacterium]
MWDRTQAWLVVMIGPLLAFHTADIRRGVADDGEAAPSRFTKPPFEVLTSKQQRQVEQSIALGLQYLGSQQQADGSFLSRDSGQPGITGLCVMAYLSNGVTPDQGPDGERLIRAIDFVLQCQQPEGYLSQLVPEPSHVHDGASHAINYNNAIAGLMLGEAYGMCSDEQNARIATAIERSLKFMREQQLKAKRRAIDRGGVRYMHQRTAIDADLSVTSWQIMFMRSALNAGYEVPKEYIDDAMSYVRSCYRDKYGAFIYGHSSYDGVPTRGTAGGGIVCLSLGGEHNTDIARETGRWILNQSFDRYNNGAGPYHYGAYYCSQAMFQLGGDYWERFYPRFVDSLTRFQGNDGSWDIERNINGDTFGQCYTTALCVLALTPPYQLLPIYQR